MIFRATFFQSLVFIVLGMPSLVFAFPDMVRHGYNNCTACHVSPAGGGMLTSYGRSLSSEALSTWGNEDQAGVLWGVVNREAMENPILLGGNIRSVQLHREDASRKLGKWINMQADVEVGYVVKQWAAVIKIGEEDGNNHWTANGTEAYGMWKPRDELTFRAGRFVPEYGLHIPDHIAYMRSFLGFGLNGVRDTFEAQWTGEKYTFSASHSKEFDNDDPEQANTVQAQVFFWDRFKVAVNYWVGNTHGFKRDITGIWSVLGFTKKFFLVSEVDLQNQKLNGSTNVPSVVSYNKLGYTLFKGFDLLFLSEHLHTDLNRHMTITNRNGPGFQFYPAPHFEFIGAWTKQASAAPGVLEEDYAWLLLHYYL